MKYFFQFILICVLMLIGEILAYVIPFPIPASIYGLIILFLGLLTGMIKLEHVEETADFLLLIMPVLFVPAAVSLMTKWELLKDNILGILVICIVSTILVMGITGRIAQKLMNKKKKVEE